MRGVVRFSAVLAAAFLSVLPLPAGAEDIAVIVDEAKLEKLPDGVATLVVGNPLIADVSLQPGGLMVLTGKGFGSTNLVALDRAGKVLMDKTIRVQGPTSSNMIVVFRGVERESYSCTPMCERRITLGDSATYFGATLQQSATRNASAGAK